MTVSITYISRLLDNTSSSRILQDIIVSMCVVNESLASIVATHLLNTKLKHTPPSLSANLFKFGVGCLNLELKVQIQNYKDLILEACIDYEGFKCV